MNIKNNFKKVFKSTKPLFEHNKRAIDAYNKQIIPVALVISMFALLIPVFFAVFRESMRPTVPAYFITFGAVGLMLIMFYLKPLNKRPLVFVYLFGLFFFLLVAYLSLIRFDTRPAGTALTFFVVAPLLFVDKSYKINTFVFVMYIIHLILSYQIKGVELGSVDLINTSISWMLGLLFGRLFLITRLNTFDMERLLRIEKETDFLTGLYNRRKLYDDIEVIEDLTTNDIGILMIDIDNFKRYNDQYGHGNGDTSLKMFSRLLYELKDGISVKFYRIGGEEFVGVTEGLEVKQLIAFAEKIRKETKKLDTPHEKITVSIGITRAARQTYQNIDHFLDRADKALYKAKDNGRDRVETDF